MNKIAKIFCIALLLNLGVTSTAQAWSWDSIKQSITNAVENKLFILSAAGFATLGIMGYMLYKSRTKPRNPLAKPQLPLPQETRQTAKAIQIPVLPQSEPATCGYHATKNALIAWQLYNANQPINKGESYTNKEYFSSHLDPWKLFIIKDRKKNALARKIQEPLQNYLPKTEEYNQYRISFGKIGMGKADYLISSYFDNPINTYVIDQPTIIQLIQQAFNENLHILMSEEDIYTALPQLTELDKFTITDKSLREDIVRKFTSFDEWLEGNEIDKLFKEETSTQLTENTVSTLNSIEQIDAAFMDSENNTILKKWRQNRDCMHIFIVGTMQERLRNSGHWFTVIAQKRNGVPSFYVMDSLGSDRTKDERVTKIITALNR